MEPPAKVMEGEPAARFSPSPGRAELSLWCMDWVWAFSLAQAWAWAARVSSQIKAGRAPPGAAARAGGC